MRIVYRLDVDCHGEVSGSCAAVVEDCFPCDVITYIEAFRNCHCYVLKLVLIGGIPVAEAVFICVVVAQENIEFYSLAANGIYPQGLCAGVSLEAHLFT